MGPIIPRLNSYIFWHIRCMINWIQMLALSWQRQLWDWRFYTRFQTRFQNQFKIGSEGQKTIQPNLILHLSFVLSCFSKRQSDKGLASLRNIPRMIRRKLSWIEFGIAFGIVFQPSEPILNWAWNRVWNGQSQTRFRDDIMQPCSVRVKKRVSFWHVDMTYGKSLRGSRGCAGNPGRVCSCHTTGQSIFVVQCGIVSQMVYKAAPFLSYLP